MNNQDDEYEALVHLIRSKSDELSPTHRRIADRLLEDPQRTAFLSVKQAASLARANEATVVRFAQKLGFSGFLELRSVFQHRLNQHAHALSDVSQIESMRSRSEDAVATAAAISRDTIATTADNLDRKAWHSAAQMAATAPRIFTLGLRHSYAATYLLTYLLAMSRDDVAALGTETGVKAEALRSLRPDDVVIVISTEPYARETITAARWVRERNTTIVALTDSDASPLASIADYCFVARTERTTILPSAVGLTFLAESFAAHVALVDPPATQKIAAIEGKLLTSLHTHWTR